MRNGTHTYWRPMFGLELVLGALLAACTGSFESADPAQANPSISISVPTSAPTYSTNYYRVNLGGTISHASFVLVRNDLTGSTTEGYVNYSDGNGSWFAEVYGIGFGDNPLTVTADEDGHGARTAQAHITVIRPLEPATVIMNGPDQLTAATYWTDATSFPDSFKIAFFEDGTGRSTTGSKLSENAGPVVTFTWSLLGPDSIVITNCPDCSFQKIYNIQGSLSDAEFGGIVETVGGTGYQASDSFILTSGSL